MYYYARRKYPGTPDLQFEEWWYTMQDLLATAVLGDYGSMIDVGWPWYAISQWDIISHEGKSLADFVGKVETLQADWDTLSTQLGFPSLELPHVNRSPERNPDYRPYYSDRMAEDVGAVYIDDITKFGYTF